MVLSSEDAALISIIVTNQRRIDKILKTDVRNYGLIENKTTRLGSVNTVNDIPSVPADSHVSSYGIQTEVATIVPPQSHPANPSIDEAASDEVTAELSNHSYCAKDLKLQSTSSLKNKMNNNTQDPRRKFKSSSSLEDNVFDSSRLQSAKRKRCSSSSVSQCTSDKTDFNGANQLNTVPSDQTTLPASEVNPRKRKTKILPSPLRNGPLKLNPSTGILKRIDSQLTPDPPSSTKIQPYVSCWANCPIREHIFPRNEFIEHLNTFHGLDRELKLVDQQVVCTCFVCESVVDYCYSAKYAHLERCTGGWQQQFYLFLENASDEFAIPSFNAPTTVNSLKDSSSLAHHPHLDTLTWRNVKDEVFYYHYCSACLIFIEDDHSLVAQHTSTAMHRVKMRQLIPFSSGN